MIKNLLYYFFIIIIFNNICFAISLNEAKIGFKGIYLGQNAIEACKVLQEKFSSEKYVYIKKGELDELRLVSSINSCKTKSVFIAINEDNKVERIIFYSSAFGVEKMPLEEFAKLIINNTNWLPKLDYRDDIKYFEGYYYTDDKELGFEIRIGSRLDIQLSNSTFAHRKS
ncbi:hypothetical protein ACOL3J_10805 [Aliarcobacter butzleri]